MSGLGGDLCSQSASILVDFIVTNPEVRKAGAAITQFITGHRNSTNNKTTAKLAAEIQMFKATTIQNLEFLMI